MIYKCSKCGFPNEINKRSNKMNRYLHLAIGILANELGYDANEMKDVLKYHFGLYKKIVNKQTGEEIISYAETSAMTSGECSQFIEQIVRFGAEQGISILTPEEYFQT